MNVVCFSLCFCLQVKWWRWTCGGCCSAKPRQPSWPKASTSWGSTPSRGCDVAGSPASISVFVLLRWLQQDPRREERSEGDGLSVKMKNNCELHSRRSQNSLDFESNYKSNIIFSSSVNILTCEGSFFIKEPVWNKHHSVCSQSF